MNLWEDACDSVNAFDADAAKLTVDQRLKLAHIKVLLSISQELSTIHHKGINPQYENAAKAEELRREVEELSGQLKELSGRRESLAAQLQHLGDQLAATLGPIQRESQNGRASNAT